MAKRSRSARRRPTAAQRLAAVSARIAEAQARKSESEANSDQTNQVAQTRSVNIPIPTITIVHYNNRSYVHVNGQPTGRGYDPAFARIVQEAFEDVEATGAIKIAEQDLRHLTV